MTVYMVISLPKIPYTHRIYIWFWPTLHIYHIYHIYMDHIYIYTIYTKRLENGIVELLVPRFMMGFRAAEGH